MQHARDGIAIADAALASGAGAAVKGLARRTKTDEQAIISSLQQTGRPGSTPSPELVPTLDQLKSAKGPAADDQFLRVMIAHHAMGVMLTESALSLLRAPSLKSVANDAFARQARLIGELQRLRDASRPASG
jgi:uncharacterized protein (DUF305 family)